MWDHLADFWTAVATAFRGVNGLLGYELMNEPFAKSPFADDAALLGPLYQRLNAAIRAVDDDSIVFYESLVLSAPEGQPTHMVAGPGGPEYDDRQAFSFHVYCFNGTTAATLPLCRLALEINWRTNLLSLARLGGGGRIVTEFGAVPQDSVSLEVLETVLDAADAHLTSWAYWTFKTFGDITTSGNPHSETLCVCLTHV